MSVKAEYRNGVFTPVGRPEGLRLGGIYTVLSEDELRDLREALQLRRSEKSFDFWDNREGFIDGLE